MLSFVARLNLVLMLGWAATLSNAAVIEIAVHDARTNPVPNARLLQWEGLPSKASLLARASDIAGDQKSRNMPNTSPLLQVAVTTAPRTGADDFLPYHEYYWQTRNGTSGMAGSLEGSMQETEIWPLIIIGVGLIAYQLRRQSRNRAGIFRIPTDRT